jgi:putative hydrolase of the HAD superfamily
MTIVRAVFFDLGGVILRTEDHGPRARLAERLGMPYQELARLVFEGGADRSGVLASLGQISEQQHWHTVMRTLGLPEEGFEQFRDEFFAGDEMDMALLGFLRSLRPGRKTGLISNAWSDMRSWLEAQGHTDAFNILTISAEVGIAKPAAGIYELALRAAGVQPAESAFVDDTIENVEASRALGMQGIHFRSTEQTLAELRQVLGQ